MIHPRRNVCLTILLSVVLCGIAESQTDLNARQLIDQGTAFSKARQYDKAADAFREAIKLDPNLSRAQAGLGVALIGMVRNADAVEPLKTAVILDPQNVMAYANLGTAYLNLHRFDEALGAYGEAAKLRPKDPYIFGMMGNAAGNAGKYEDSIGYFKKASELNPRDPAVFHNIGVTYNRMGKYADAIEPFKTCVSLKPDYKSAQFNLGIAYSKTGHYAEAIDSLTKFLELSPDDPNGLINRGWNYFYAGNFGKEAALDAQKYLKLYGWRTNASPYEAIISIIGYRSAGMDIEAVTAIDQSQKKLASDTWQFDLIRYFAGQLTSDELLKIAVSNDQRTEAHAYIGIDLRIKGRPDDAKPHFRWAKEYGNGTFVEYTLAIAELSRLP